MTTKPAAKTATKTATKPAPEPAPEQLPAVAQRETDDTARDSAWMNRLGYIPPNTAAD